MFIDPSVIRYLRSEVLKGFVLSDDFRNRRANWMSRDGPDLLESTATMLPEVSKEDQQRRLNTFRCRVLEPAFDVAVAIQTSATRYSFSERMTQETRFKCCPLRHHISDSCTMINIDTRLEAKVNQPTKRNHDKVIAQQVLFIYPGLVRYDEHSAKRLTDDIVCAKFPSPAGKLSPDLQQIQQQSANDSDGGALATPTKKRKVERDGQTHSSPIDVEEPIETEKEDTPSDGKKRRIKKGSPTHSSPIDVEEPLETEREDTPSDGKKRRIKKDGPTRSSPIDVEEPLETEREDTPSDGKERRIESISIDMEEPIETEREDTQSDESSEAPDDQLDSPTYMNTPLTVRMFAQGIPSSLKQHEHC